MYNLSLLKVEAQKRISHLYHIYKNIIYITYIIPIIMMFYPWLVPLGEAWKFTYAQKYEYNHCVCPIKIQDFIIS